MLRRVLLRLTLLTSTTFSALALGPGLIYGHEHDVNHCGPDINQFASAVTQFIGTPAAGADSFDKDYTSPMCGLLEDKSTFLNQFDHPARHRFKTSYTKRTEYSVKVSAGFKGAFEAEMNYTSDNTATEEYDTEIEIPPRRAAKLSVSPSLTKISGTWRHGFWGRHSTNVETFRPTGHLLWLLRDVTDTQGRVPSLV
ncbi:MAG: hypothetical protein ACRDHS_14745 [Actinomycetota bacterium]